MIIDGLFLASKEEGLFRVPGNQADVDELKKSYDLSMSHHFII